MTFPFLPRIRFLALYFAAWLPVAALYAYGVAGQPYVSLADAAIAGGASTFMAALLGLAVWRGAPRIQWQDGTRLRSLAVHLACAAAYTLLWNGGVIWQIATFAPPAALERYLDSAFGFQLLNGITLYAVVASVSSIAAAERRTRVQRELAARSEVFRAEAELRALRAQLDPHFLFNTLHTIMSLVRTDQTRAEEGLSQLADLLRYVLAAHDGRGDEVPLSDEVHFVRSYLELEHLRFGDRLRVEWDVGEDAEEGRVLSFTLQALVENAVRHAVSRSARGATIQIQARADGDRLRLRVADDGPGATVENNVLKGGVGLSAVRRRLHARFGDKATLSIESEPGSGFIATVECPAIPSFNSTVIPGKAGMQVDSSTVAFPRSLSRQVVSRERESIVTSSQQT